MLEQIRQTWAEIALLLGVGGGFWLTLEPPVGELSGTLSGFVGAVSLAAVFGVRSVLSHYPESRGVRNATLAAALACLVVAVLAFAVFVVDRSSLVMKYEQGGATTELVKGTRYHTAILSVKRQQMMSDMDLLRSVGGPGNREAVWERASIVDAERRLALGYVLALLLTLWSTMFFVETLRNRSQTTAGKP